MSETHVRANLHPAQRAIHDSPARFRVVSAGRRFGKTRLGVNECLDVAAHNGRAWWVAPTYKIARVGWRPIRRIAARIPGCQVKESDMGIILPGGGEVYVRSANDPDSLRGEGLDFVVLDEAAYIAQEAWFEALRPALSDRQGRALFISTPSGRNWFWELYRRGGDEGWQSFTYPTSANPYIPPAEIEAARRDLSEIIYRQEFLAEFVDNAGAVFRRVRECATSEAIDQPEAGRQYVAAVDPATAQDYTAVSVFDVEARRQVYLDRFGRVDYPVLQARLDALCKRFQLERMRVEINSIGRPVFDHLAAAGLPVEAFTTTNSTKGAIIQRLISALEHGELSILDDDTQTGELLSFEAKQTASGATTYSAPGGLHDDTVMALAMAWDMLANRPWLITEDDYDDTDE